MNLKEKLLDYFMEHTDRIISGQDLAQVFDVTRSAVWKAIEELRNQGYIIESISRKGYRLVKYSNDLDAQQIMNQLSTDWENLTIEVHDEVTSTNDLAKIFGVSHPKRTHLIIARKQTKGRGRYGKSFHSSIANGLYMSLLIPIKDIKIENIPLITIATATAMSEAIEELYGKTLAIKWVNDLFLEGRKVSGILCEALSDLESRTISSVVVGLGLNLAGEFDQADEQVRSVAGTLFGEQLPKDFNYNELISLYLNKLSGYINHLEAREFITYYSNHLLGINTKVSYQSNGQWHEGIIRGINQQGHLLFEHEDGMLEELFGQEIHLSSQQFAKE
ncbi:biotin--[acetyl-CoA-carboxylase] ligase [Aerococcaceae bacterium WGS1372]